MVAETVDIGTVSARGQIAIPAEMREKMQLKEGEKVLFLLEGDTLLMKKASAMSWEEITRPLHQAARLAGMKESEIPELVHRIRRKK